MTQNFRETFLTHYDLNERLSGPPTAAEKAGGKYCRVLTRNISDVFLPKSVSSFEHTKGVRLSCRRAGQPAYKYDLYQIFNLSKFLLNVGEFTCHAGKVGSVEAIGWNDGQVCVRCQSSENYRAQGIVGIFPVAIWENALLTAISVNSEEEQLARDVIKIVDSFTEAEAVGLLKRYGWNFRKGQRTPKESIKTTIRNAYSEGVISASGIVNFRGESETRELNSFRML